MKCAKLTPCLGSASVWPKTIKKARKKIAFPGLVLNSVHPKGGRDEQAASTAMMGHCSGAIGALAHIGQNIFCSTPMASTTHCDTRDGSVQAHGVHAADGQERPGCPSRRQAGLNIKPDYLPDFPSPQRGGRPSSAYEFGAPSGWTAQRIAVSAPTMCLLNRL